MRILWIKMGGLWPLNTGGRQRTFHILSALSQHHDVVLVTTTGADDDVEGLRAHLTECAIIARPYAVPKYGSARFVGAVARSWASPWPADLWKWRVRALRREIAALVERDPFDVIVADFMFAMPNVPIASPAPVVLFAHNVEHLIWKRLHDVEPYRWRRALLAIEWRKMRRAEAAAVRRTAATIAVSEADRDALRACAPAADVMAIPTGVDVEYFRPAAREDPNRLVFSGSMDWYPNEDAMRTFFDRIWPALTRRMPGLEMTVVGRNPSARLIAEARAAGVAVTGTVPDVRPFIGEAAVYVVPLRVGGGTRLKIFEALAMGKAVVSTTIGAEGLGLEPDRHFVAADTDERFTEAVLELLTNPQRRRALGLAGRELVATRYSWPQVAREFEACLSGVVKRHERTPEYSDRRFAVS